MPNSHTDGVHDFALIMEDRLFNKTIQIFTFSSIKPKIFQFPSMKHLSFQIILNKILKFSNYSQQIFKATPVKYKVFTRLCSPQKVSFAILPATRAILVVTSYLPPLPGRS